MVRILFLISLMAHFVYTLWKLKKDLHILQLNSYMNSRYLRWIQKNHLKTLNLKDFLPGLSVFPLFFELNFLPNLIWISSYIFLLFARVNGQEKKRLVFTSRAVRLFSISLLLLFVLSLLAFYFILHAKTIYITIGTFTFFVILNVFSFSIVTIANFIITPVERAINKWYYNDARKRINRMPRLTVIGITGSFGKTSTKYILNKILCEEFNILMTPESYNTTMGVTKVIRTSLKPIHDIFIVEMGAKQRGDIRELCKLVSPQLGLLTAIGEQHLETFKSLENIKSTKNELIESLPGNGIAFLNMENKYIRDLSQSIKIKKICYGVESDDLDYSAQDIKYASNGSTFTIRKYDGSKVVFQTKLLGKHNISNIIAAVSAACELGIDLKVTSYIVKNLKPIPHRLELKRTSQGITIIDDAFNANPVGSHIALDVLKEMTSNNKILVTPGMVELGEKECELNRAFGIHATEICDYIILVGPKRTVPIQEELRLKNFSYDRYYVAKDLNDANQHLQKITQPGDVILFENDLPDTYNE